MYEWNESDNADYLDFLKGFMFSAEPTAGEVHDDEEADPEYNAMEDEEDDHDKEEHRVDRAVKVTKKELNELVAELFENCFPNTDEFEDIPTSPGQRQEEDTEALLDTSSPSASTSKNHVSSSLPKPDCRGSDSNTNELTNSSSAKGRSGVSSESEIRVDGLTSLDPPDPDRLGEEDLAVQTSDTSVRDAVTQDQQAASFENVPVLTIAGYKTLKHQLQQHIQLLAQTYVLSAQVQDPAAVKAAQTSKSLLVRASYFIHAFSCPAYYLLILLQYEYRYGYSNLHLYPSILDRKGLI
jgi:hypothetical protein